MPNLDLEFRFEERKRSILAKLKATNEKWQAVWQKAQGNPLAEAELIQLKLEIQIRETEALAELKLLEEKVKEASEDGLAAPG